MHCIKACTSYLHPCYKSAISQFEKIYVEKRFINSLLRSLIWTKKILAWFTLLIYKIVPTFLKSPSVFCLWSFKPDKFLGGILKGAEDFDNEMNHSLLMVASSQALLVSQFQLGIALPTFRGWKQALCRSVGKLWQDRWVLASKAFYLLLRVLDQSVLQQLHKKTSAETWMAPDTYFCVQIFEFFN